MLNIYNITKVIYPLVYRLLSRYTEVVYYMENILPILKFKLLMLTEYRWCEIFIVAVIFWYNTVDINDIRHYDSDDIRFGLTNVQTVLVVIIILILVLNCHIGHTNRIRPITDFQSISYQPPHLKKVGVKRYQESGITYSLIYHIRAIQVCGSLLFASYSFKLIFIDKG